MAGTLLWLPAIRHEQVLARVGTAWAVMSALMTLFIGLVIFEEHLSRWNILGVAFAITALVLLQQ